MGSLLVALTSGLLLAGVPVWWRLRSVRREAEGNPLEAADLILVLGRRLAEDRPTDVFVARLAHAEALWRRGVAARILVAGGLTSGATHGEAEAGARWLLERGVDSAAVFTEGRSQHTLENLFNVREQVRAEGWSRVIVVSDPLHLARARACAEGLGLAVQCAPAPGCPPRPRSFSWWQRALLEAFLLHWYHTGLLYSRLLKYEFA